MYIIKGIAKIMLLKIIFWMNLSENLSLSHFIF